MGTRTLLGVGICLWVVNCSPADEGGHFRGAAGKGGGSSSASTGGTSATSSTSGGGASATTSSSGPATTATGTTSTSGSGGVGGAVGAGGSTTTGGMSGNGGSSGAGGSGMSGAGGSGGNGGSGPPAKDAGGPGGGPVSGCVGVTAKFCDDFEKQTGATPIGDFTVSGGGITVDATKAFSGTKSLHWKPGTQNQLVFTKQFPFNDLHGRMMLFMVKTPTTGSHWDIIQSNNAGNTQWEIGGQTGNFELVCDPPDHGLDSKTKFPDTKWVCLQWEFKFVSAGADTSFLAKVDGVAVDQGMFTGANSKNEKWVAGAWQDLHVGWEIFGGATAVEFWIDDLAFGDQPIPCPTP